MLRNVATNQKIKHEEEDLEEKLELPKSSIFNGNDQIEIIHDNLDVEPENADEKIRL